MPDREIQLPEQYAAAEALERFLGDPADERSPLGFARAVEADEREQYPEQACALLDAWGLSQYYVPAGCGGRLASYEELMALIRCVARRNLSVAVAHAKTYLGGAAVWAGGSDEQMRRLARRIRRGEQVALAYHEQAHGSDLLATEMKAEKVPGGYLLSGEKWLVNNATRGTALTVFARTDEQGGPRGFSLFLVEKDTLDPDSFHLLPRLKTLGVRGVDFSGIRFKESFVPDDALIGPEGTALEQTLKAFQQTRTVIPALSLGAADTALRCALSFALERRLYGGTAFDLAPTRRLLAGSLSDLLLADCQAVGCARALQYAPARMRLYSAAVKYYVPTLVEGVVGRAARVLGARHYLREGHWSGIFQKILRDNKVLSIFHAGTFLNLTTIGIHLRELAREAEGGDPAAEAERAHQRLAPVFDLRAALPSPDPSRLRLFCRGGDDLLASLPALASRAEGPGVEPRVAASLGAALRRLTEVWEAERERQRESERRLGGGYGESPEMFEAAGRYSALHAAASAAQVWVRNRDWMDEGLAGGEWLALGLMRVLRRLGAGEGLGAEAEYEAVVCAMMRGWEEEGRMFSVVPLRLAGGLAHAAGSGKS